MLLPEESQTLTHVQWILFWTVITLSQSAHTHKREREERRGEWRVARHTEKELLNNYFYTLKCVNYSDFLWYPVSVQRYMSLQLHFVF